jgi:acyl-coenzyme A thioesterase PaaI-like protein
MIFETKLIRPIHEGKIIAKGELLKNLGGKLEARAKLFNEAGKLVGSGIGTFIKSQQGLSEIESYKIS